MVTITEEYRANTEHFYITLHPATFLTRESFNLARITKDFQLGIADSTRHSIEEILKLSSKGRCYIPSFIENDEDQYHFVSSQLMAIDVDDDEQVTDPQEVLNQLKDICAGLYFTGSHGIKGNRYRLLFVFDKAIRSQAQYKDIFNQLVRRLISIGIPADTNVQDGLQRIRTATNGYILGNPKARLEIDEYLLAAQEQREKEFEARRNNLIDFASRKKFRDYSVAELKDRAQAIGYVEEYTEWEALAYSLKSYAHEGKISDEEAYEVFEILCGGNSEINYWEKLKPNSTNIGKFINASKLAGYKSNFKYYHAVSNNKFDVSPISHHNFDQYIPEDFAMECLEQEKNLLIKSDTGTGKTSAFINAAKALAETKDKPSRYFIFAVPTRAIAMQTGNDKKVLWITGETKDIFKILKEYHEAGKRVIACTYDMAIRVQDLLKKINVFASFTLMVDEIHHFTYSYKYRRDAINKLNELKKVAKGFIGLSGTPEDVLKNIFDEEVHIQTKRNKAPVAVFGAITYKQMRDEEVALIQLLRQKAESGKKLLVFIQNTTLIKKLQRVLSNLGVSTKTITADSKKNNVAYRQIVDESKFPDDTQVLLTTTVISDGINIKGAQTNYECIVVCSRKSQLFNVATIRQISNRYRFDSPTALYGALYLFMLEPKKQSEYFFNIDEAHLYEKRLAQNSIDLLSSEFARKDDTRLFRAASLEKRYGIKFEDGIPQYDEFQIRYNVAQEKELFYSIFRDQFIKACSQSLQIQAKDSLDISEYLAQNEEIVSPIEDTLERLRAIEVEDATQLAEKIGEFYSSDVHAAFRNPDGAIEKEIIEEFRRLSTQEHFKCLQGISSFTDHETAVKIVKKVKSRTDIYSFQHKVKALMDIAYFEKVRRKTPTKIIFQAFCKYIGKELTRDELLKISKKIQLQSKVAKENEVKQVLGNYFTQEKTRTKTERFTILQILTFMDIADEFGLSESELDKIIQEKIQFESDIEKLIFNEIEFKKA